MPDGSVPIVIRDGSRADGDVVLAGDHVVLTGAPDAGHGVRAWFGRGIVLPDRAIRT